jgi:hypothetical protein
MDVIASFEATFFGGLSFHFPQFISKAKVDTHQQQSAHVMGAATKWRTRRNHGSQKKKPVSTDMNVDETRYVRGKRLLSLWLCEENNKATGLKTVFTLHIPP